MIAFKGSLRLFAFRSFNRMPTEPGTDSLKDIERFLRSGQEWLKKRHEEGAAGEEICQSRSALMDNVLRRLWKGAFRAPGEKEAEEGVALLAMGGYGKDLQDEDSRIQHVWLESAASNTSRYFAATTSD